MSFEELRLEYQCPEKLARRLFDDCAELRARLIVAEAAATIAQAHRVCAENKLAMAVPRRINRDREED